jgi:hypothetical protein
MPNDSDVVPSLEDELDAALNRELELEHSLSKHVVLAILVAVPVMVVFWIGLMALAASLAGVGYLWPIAMGAGIGVLAGVFWGAWAGFALVMPALDQLDHDIDKVLTRDQQRLAH